MAIRESKTILTAEDRTAGAFASMQKNLQTTMGQFERWQGMFAGLAGGAGVGAFGMIIKNALDTGEALNKMSQKTGIAVEQLDDPGVDLILEQLHSEAEFLERRATAVEHRASRIRASAHRLEHRLAAQRGGFEVAISGRHAQDAHDVEAERPGDGVDQLKQLAVLGGFCAQATNIQNKSGGPSGPPLGTTPLDAGLTM